MLPDFLNQDHNAALSCRKSFAESLCDGYHFEIKFGTNFTDLRSLFYYNTEDTLLVSHARSNRVHLLNLETGRLRWFDNHGTSVRSIKVSNNEIVTGSWDGSVGVTCFESLKLRMKLTEKTMGRCPDAVTSPENDFVYSYSYDSDKDPMCKSNTVRQWKIADGKLGNVLHLPGEHLKSRRCGSCEVYDNHLYVASDTGYLNLYDCGNWNLIAEEFCSELLAAMCILPSLNLLAVGSSNGSIFLCDLGSLKIRSRIKAHSGALNQLLLHPGNPEIMISASFDGMVKMWHLPDLELLGSINTNGENLWCVTIVNDMLITGGEGGDILIFDICNLNDIKLKGTLVISEKSYAYIPFEKKSFYASDLSIVSVKRDIDGIVITDQYSEYLLNSSCDFSTFRELFQPVSYDKKPAVTNNRGYYQIRGTNLNNKL